MTNSIFHFEVYYYCHKQDDVAFTATASNFDFRTTKCGVQCDLFSRYKLKKSVME